MRKLILTLSNKHQVFLRYLLVLNTIVLIVFMLPRETQFNYTYKVGKPWVYESIIAPFDFAINKSEEEINKEKVDRLKAIHPFYRVNSLAGDQKIIQFKNGLYEAAANAQAYKGANAKNIAYQEETGTDILQEIFDKVITQIRMVVTDGRLIYIFFKLMSMENARSMSLSFTTIVNSLVVEITSLILIPSQAIRFRI